MAVRTTTQFKALYGTSGSLFPDNTTGEISEADVRAFGEDIADSFLNESDDPYTSPFPQVTASGTDTYTATASPAISAYATGQKFQIKFTNGSTGVSTLNLNTLGAKKIYTNPTTQATTGDITAAQIYLLIYDATLDAAAGGFLMIGSGGGGAVDSVNSQTGVVVLDAADVGADPAGTAAAAVAGLAPLASPTFTGTPAAPTPTAATKTTQLATTAFVLTEMPYSVAASDEVTPITASDRITFPWPFPGTTTLVNVIGFLGTPQTSGSIFTIDIEKNGTTILSTLLTIDNTQYNSSTATTPVVISVPSIAFLDRITVVVTQIGDNTAKGLKLIFVR